MNVSPAVLTAFERGQDDARNNRPHNNPYPPENRECHANYELGYEEELGVREGF